MDLMERTYSALIVSAADSLDHALADMMPASRFDIVSKAGSISAAGRILTERAYDIVIINSPLPDDPGMRFALDAVRRGGTIVLLLVQAALYDQVYAKMSPHGVFVISKPLSRRTLETALDGAVSARERVRMLETGTVSIEEKMEEIRLVNRAKWLLIDRQHMDEPAAHRAIEKQAMDRCLTRREIAEEIIGRYAE